MGDRLRRHLLPGRAEDVVMLPGGGPRAIFLPYTAANRARASPEEPQMVFKPNYNFQRAERERAKEAKAEAKRLEKAEAKRRAAAGEPEPEPTPDAPEPDAPDAA